VQAANKQRSEMGIQELKNRALHLLAETVIVKEKVTADVAKERMNVCNGCEKRNKVENTCSVCGCFLDLKTGARTNWNAKKMRNEITHCPLGKWSDKETANLYREMDGKQLLN